MLEDIRRKFLRFNFAVDVEFRSNGISFSGMTKPPYTLINGRAYPRSVIRGMNQAVAAATVTHNASSSLT